MSDSHYSQNIMHIARQILWLKTLLISASVFYACFLLVFYLDIRNDVADVGFTFRWRLIYYLIAFMSASVLFTNLFIVLVIRELKYRKSLATGLKKIHVTEDGHPILTHKELDKLITVIEEGKELAVSLAIK